jgi:hypothetical protein
MPIFSVHEWSVMLRIRVSLAAVVFLTMPAFATLGEDVSSVQADQARMKAAVRFLPGQSYSVHEMREPSGTVVREFVSPAGAIFGVTWQGSFTPDLRQLLGTHFEEYVQAAQAPTNRRGRGLHIETDDMVFESGGHMRFIIGRAYLRSKMPQGVRADEIR